VRTPIYDPVQPPRVNYVRVCCISDTHTQHLNIPKGIPQCDLLIHAGDITYDGNLEKLARFNDWGAALPLPKERKICVAGNHDRSLEKDPEVATEQLSNWTYLKDSGTEVLGLRVWGSPYSCTFYPEHWVFNVNRGEDAKQQWSKIPDGIDILVAHGPPYGYGDRVSRNLHVGCLDLSAQLKVVRPRLTVCGHIHEAYGVYAAPWGTVVNASVLTEGYKPKRMPVLIDLPVVVEED